MFIYQKRKNDRLCVVFNDPQQLPVKEPDIELWQEDDGKICVRIGDKLICSGGEEEE